MTDDEVLVSLVGRFFSLLPSTHESPARNDTRFDLRQVHLHHHTLFAGISVSDLGNTVARTSNLQKNLLVHALLCRRNHELGFLQVPRRSASGVGLMLLSLGVCEVGTFIGVEGETETTFEGTKVVAQDIGILTACRYLTVKGDGNFKYLCKINSLKRKLPQPLPPVDIGF